MARVSLIGQIADSETGQTYADRIVAAVEGGMFFADACAYAGIGESAAYSWVRRGRDAIAQAAEHELAVPATEKLYAEFAQAVEKARAKAKHSALGAIRAAWEAGQWQAAAWYMERTEPEKYARRTVARITTPTNPDREPDAALDALLAELDDGAGDTLAAAGLADA